MKPRAWKRWIVRGAVVAVLALPVGLLTGWLAVQHIPLWYAPPTVTSADLARIRASLPDAYQAFTDLLAAHRPFDFELSARMINEWIAARGDIWPDARGGLPEWMHEPVVGFVNGRVVLAARYERGAWRAIVSAHFTVSVEGDDLIIRLVKLATGSLPWPMAPTVEALDRRLAGTLNDHDRWPDAVARSWDALDRLDSIRTLQQGLRVDNRLYWSNGERRFRIAHLRARDGLLTLTVESL